jgi:hypothetical protein
VSAPQPELERWKQNLGCLLYCVVFTWVIFVFLGTVAAIMLLRWLWFATG